MAFPGSARAIGLPRGVDVQHESRDLRPVGAVLGSVEQAEIGNQVLFVVARQSRRRRSQVGDVWVEGWLLHDRTVKDIIDRETIERGAQPE